MSGPQPTAARPAAPEPLTAETVAPYLAARGVLPDAAGARVTVLSGGVSNLAFWVEWPGGDCVVKQARPQLAVEMEWLADVRRIIREAEAMAWLRERVGPPEIPEMLYLDRERMVMAMEAVRPPAENYKTRLLRGEVQPHLAERFGDLLARIHNATRDAATRERFGDATFFDELRLSPYYDTAGARHPDVAARLADLRAECRQRTYCLVHGDYSPKNILVHDDTLVLLDYEVAHFGNPSFDLGFALTHYLCKALHVAGRGPAFIDAARRFWRTYRERSEVPAEAVARAGMHLAAVMLARMDGKSPLEYFTDEGQKDTVRHIARDTLLAERGAIPAVIDAVEAALP